MPIRSTVGGSRLLGRGPVSIVTGGTLSSDSTYFYRTFTGNGNLVVSGVPLACQYFIVAGGGSGGSSGGGGGGGVREITATLSPNTYPVVVGAGGPVFSNGSPSSFNSSIASGGGAGGGNGTNASTGGAGGGGAFNASTSGAAGNAGGFTPVEGFIGGNSAANSGGGGGGGGGASDIGGAKGQDIGPGPYTGGATGGSGSFGSYTNVNGTLTLYADATGTGQAQRYAGGGGGGAIAQGTPQGGPGGAGGGGRGGIGGNPPSFATGDNGVAGLENTGGGGGGCGFAGTGTGQSGGKGIVIVRYLKSAV